MSSGRPLLLLSQQSTRDPNPNPNPGEGGLELPRSGWRLHSRSSRLPGRRCEGWALTAEVPRGVLGDMLPAWGYLEGLPCKALEDVACFQAGVY